MPAPSVVQAVTSHNSAAAFLPVPLTTTTAGNLAVVVVQAYSATPVTGLAVSSVTLGADPFTQAFTQAVQPGTWVNAVWVDQGCSGGLSTAGVTLSGANSSTQLNVIVYEITGWLPGYPLDILTTAYSTAAAAPWSATVQDTQASALWIGVLTAEGNPSFTVTGPAAPWAANGTGTIPNSVSPAFTRMQGWTNPQTSQGSVTFSGSLSSPQNWATILLAIPGSLTTGPASLTVSDTTGGSSGQAGVWGCPPGTAAVTVALTAPGGGGGGGSSTNVAGGGGGGGEYTRNPAVAVSAGGWFGWATGTPGAGGPGGTTGGGSAGTAGGNAFFTGSAVTATANGGLPGGGGGTSVAGAGGAGGTGSTAPTHFSGGPGAGGTSTTSGGGGGGSGGTGSAGNSGSGSGGATAVTGGGPGGAGGFSTFRPTPPVSGPGGGGGGGLFVSGGAEAGAAGWAGQLALTYTISPPSPSLIIPGPQAMRRASSW